MQSRVLIVDDDRNASGAFQYMVKPWDAGELRRLNVLPVVAPPLRDHGEDIPILAAHILAEALGRAPLSPVRFISDDALVALTPSGSSARPGDKDRAAAILGIDLSTLYRWQRALRD